jgi:thiamine biosynthesis lipoprotein
MLASLVRESDLLKPADDRSIAHCTVARRAMGCDFAIHFNPLVRDPVVVADGAFGEIERIEDVLSIYRPDSQMSNVNREAFDRSFRIDAFLFELLERAAELTEQTQGAIDVATGAMIKAWGFVDRRPRVPTAVEHAAVMRCCGMRHVLLDRAQMAVRYAVPGLEVNLGSIGKGYAVDHAVRWMRQEFGIECALIGGGSSSFYGIGSLWGDDGWLVGIEDPSDPARTVATVRLNDRALGTSNASNQYFEVGGRRYGHLLDPRTGWPADQVAGASALAADAATADALATAFFVMGLDKTAEFCHNHPDIAAVIVKDAPGRGNARVVTFNLSPHEVKIDAGERRA